MTLITHSSSHQLVGPILPVSAWTMRFHLDLYYQYQHGPCGSTWTYTTSISIGHGVPLGPILPVSAWTKRFHLTYTTSISMDHAVPLDLNIQTEGSPVQPTPMKCHNGRQRGTLAMQLVCPVAGNCYCY